jgi:hypothetical protein
MSVKMRRAGLAVLVVILAVLPFIVRYWHAQLDPVEISSDGTLKLIEKFNSGVVHGEKMTYHTKKGKALALLPVPKDVFFLSAAQVLPDGKKLLLAGGDAPHQKIYVAPFPPRNENDYQLLVDIPLAYSIKQMYWSPVDQDQFIFAAVELETEETRKKSPEPAANGEPEHIMDVACLDYVIYSCRLSDKTLKKVYVSEKKKTIRYVCDHHSEAMFFETDHSILFLEDKVLSRISFNGDYEEVRTLDMKWQAGKYTNLNDVKEPIFLKAHIISARKNVCTIVGEIVDNVSGEILANDQKTVVPVAVAQALTALVSVDFASNTVYQEEFLPPIENAFRFIFEEDRAVYALTSNHEKCRIGVARRDNPYERTIFEMQKLKDIEDLESLIIHGLTPDGKTAICSMSSLSQYMPFDRIMQGRKISSPQFQLIAFSFL